MQWQREKSKRENKICKFAQFCSQTLVLKHKNRSAGVVLEFTEKKPSQEGQRSTTPNISFLFSRNFFFFAETIFVEIFCRRDAFGKSETKCLSRADIWDSSGPFSFSSAVLRRVECATIPAALQLVHARPSLPAVSSRGAEIMLPTFDIVIPQGGEWWT